MAKLHDLPPELIAMITANLDFGSHMNLMLASKALCNMVREVRPKRQEWIDFNLSFERRVSPRRALTLLTCTACAKLHPRSDFTDAQGTKNNRTRFCIKSGMRRRHSLYRGKGTFLVGGVEMFGCVKCCKAWPEAEEASYNLDCQLKVSFCKGCWNATNTDVASTDLLLLTDLRRVLTDRRRPTSSTTLVSVLTLSSAKEQKTLIGSCR